MNTDLDLRQAWFSLVQVATAHVPFYYWQWFGGAAVVLGLVWVLWVFGRRTRDRFAARLFTLSESKKCPRCLLPMSGTACTCGYERVDEKFLLSGALLFRKFVGMALLFLLFSTVASQIAVPKLYDGYWINENKSLVMGEAPNRHGIQALQRTQRFVGLLGLLALAQMAISGDQLARRFGKPGIGLWGIGLLLPGASVFIFVALVSRAVAWHKHHHVRVGFFGQPQVAFAGDDVKLENALELYTDPP